MVTELSNVYLDALKDRLYCEKPGSLERRSAQTVLAELFSMLMRDLQPILSYTVDEAMAYAPAGCVDHQKYAALLDWYKSPITFDEANEFEGVLEASLELRSAVTKALEDARSAGTFTKSQQVRVKAVVPAEMYALLTGDKAVDTAEFYIVSDVELTRARNSPLPSRRPRASAATVAGTTAPPSASTTATHISVSAALTRCRLRRS